MRRLPLVLAIAFAPALLPACADSDEEGGAVVASDAASDGADVRAETGSVDTGVADSKGDDTTVDGTAPDSSTADSSTADSAPVDSIAEAGSTDTATETGAVGDTLADTLDAAADTLGDSTDAATDAPPLGLTVATVATGFSQPYGVAVDGANLWVADYGNHTVVKISAATGTVLATVGVAGSSGLVDGAAAAAKFKFPSALVVGTDGKVYVADASNHVIRVLTPTSTSYTVSTLAGSATGASGYTNASGSAARFKQPTGIAFDADGNLLVADNLNCALRKVTLAGTVTTALGGDCLAAPTPYYLKGLAVGGDGIYTSDPSNNRIKLNVLSPASSTALTAITSSGFLDGTTDVAKFNAPYGLALDATGNVVVADTSNHRIRKIVLGSTKLVSTLADGATAGLVDGGGDVARFDTPRGVAIAPDGTIYVADSGNKAIRRLK